MFDAEGNVNEHPPADYAHIITEDEWKSFIARCLDESFQVTLINYNN